MNATREKPIRIERRTAPRTYSIREASALLGISERHGHSLARENRFPVNVIRLGRRYVIPRAQLDAMLGEKTAAG